MHSPVLRAFHVCARAPTQEDERPDGVRSGEAASERVCMRRLHKVRNVAPFSGVLSSSKTRNRGGGQHMQHAAPLPDPRGLCAIRLRRRHKHIRHMHNALYNKG